MYGLKKYFLYGAILCLGILLQSASINAETNPPSSGTNLDFSALTTPLIFSGDDTTAYRDPAAIYSNGWFYLYFTYIKTESDGQVYGYTAWSKSSDLAHWTDPQIFTPRDHNLNYESPGDVIRFDNHWVLCLQTYPRPNGEKYGNKDSRIWVMRSDDLEHWGTPELLAVKGPNVTQEQMGRMIDAYLVEDRNEPGKWWCFFKQNGGVRMSWSHDLKTWTFTDSKVAGGENPCVIRDGNQYVLYYSPDNGIGVKRSDDLQTWSDEGVLKLGQSSWTWAEGRLTAGFVLDLRQDPKIGKALVFFHGSKYPEKDPRDGFDRHCSLGLAWSTDLKTWTWPDPKN